MPQQIIINQKTIEYTVRSRRRTRHLRLAVYLDGSVSVSKPFSVSLKFVREFILSKADWILTQLEKYQALPPFLSLRQSLPRSDYLSRREEARQLVATRLIHFNQFYNFKYFGFSIRNQKTRWGSCSKRGRLNFNYRLLDLPSEVADYIIVHELCHLKEFNHSANFWKLVGKSLPDYLLLRAKLRQKIA